MCRAPATVNADTYTAPHRHVGVLLFSAPDKEKGAIRGRLGQAKQCPVGDMLLILRLEFKVLC